MDRLAREDHTAVISCEMDFKYVFSAHPRFEGAKLTPCSLTGLVDRMWDELNLVRIYTKKRGAHPDLDDPVCMRKGSTVEVRSPFNYPPPTHEQQLTIHCAGRV